eukprot:COSAG02_NODE_68548_length_238_cov_2.856115_1_plen_21_part_10
MMELYNRTLRENRDEFTENEE